MSDITITFKDGRVEKFSHVGRAGGSYTKTVKFEGGFVIVTDEYYKRTAFPAGDVAKVEDKPERY